MQKVFTKVSKIGKIGKIELGKKRSTQKMIEAISIAVVYTKKIIKTSEGKKAFVRDSKKDRLCYVKNT